MNKIILAYYIKIGDMSAYEIQKVVENFKSDIKDPEMIQYFIPIRDGETRIECVYPKYVLGEQVDEEFKSAISKLNEHIKKLSNE